MSRDAPRVELWRDGAGFWRWRYVEPTSGIELVGARDHPSREAAETAARTAYPGVPLVERPSPSAAGPGGSGALFLLVVVALVAVVVVAATLLAVSAALVLAGVLVRRWLRGIRGRGVAALRRPRRH